MKAVKKWVKWSLIGVGSAVIAFILVWVILLCCGFNIFAPKGWHDGKYLNNMGKPLTGWQTIDDRTYCFTEEGSKVTGWLQTEQGKYRFDETGVLQTGWYNDQSGTYLLKPDGSVCTGWIETEQGIRYFEESGRMAVGMLELADGLWQFEADGTPYEGWYESRYFKNGKACTGWQEIDEQRYYFFPDGLAPNGWQTINGSRYFFYEGKPHVGWFTDHEDRYYFLDSGIMAVGEVEIDGVSRFFTSKGKYVVLVNFQHAMPEDYVVDLVNVEGHPFDASAAEDLKALLAAARAAGHPTYINNTYRSVYTQQKMFNRRLNSYMSGGYDEYTATQIITASLMLPGHSEHHLGLAVDLQCTKYTYKWLAENSWQYGFILRYPEGKTDITGIIYEPWHFRHVGVELAKELYDSGLTMEEYMQSISMSTMDGQ